MSKCYDNPEYDKIDDNLQNTWKQSKYIEPKQEGYICPHTKIQCDDECCVSAEDCHITSSLASGIVEPKQEYQSECICENSCRGFVNVKCKQLKKQETLEEAVESVYNEFPLRSESLNELAKENFIKGANWMEKRMFSKEDMIAIVEKSRKTGLSAEYLLLTEQFKKK
jgi:hypothetical protein